MSNAAQLHWHTGSEHTVEGKRFDMELHVVHAPAFQRPDVVANSGYLFAVLGIFFDRDPKVAS